MSTRVNLSVTLQVLLHREAEQILNEVEGAKGVVISTVDGFDLLSAVRGQMDPKRVAAMASSILAIGNVVSQEAELGAMQGLMIQSADGFAVFQGVAYQQAPLLITILADKKAVLGQINYRSGQLAKLILNA